MLHLSTLALITAWLRFVLIELVWFYKLVLAAVSLMAIAQILAEPPDDPTGYIRVAKALLIAPALSYLGLSLVFAICMPVALMKSKRHRYYAKHDRARLLSRWKANLRGSRKAAKQAAASASYRS